MSTNKHAQIRYQALDRCFRNPGRRYYIEDLIEACNRALFDQAGVVDGVKERQVRQDIRDMESIWGVPLCKPRDGKKTYYHYEDSHYSINNQLLNETEISQLKETISMLNRFKGMPQFRWMEEILARFESVFQLREATVGIVGFEENPYLKRLRNIFIESKVITSSPTSTLISTSEVEKISSFTSTVVVSTSPTRSTRTIVIPLMAPIKPTLTIPSLCNSVRAR